MNDDAVREMNARELRRFEANHAPRRNGIVFWCALSFGYGAALAWLAAKLLERGS